MKSIKTLIKITLEIKGKKIERTIDMTSELIEDLKAIQGFDLGKELVSVLFDEVKEDWIELINNVNGEK